jgi:hypothetical protein
VEKNNEIRLQLRFHINDVAPYTLADQKKEAEYVTCFRVADNVW